MTEQKNNETTEAVVPVVVSPANTMLAILQKAAKDPKNPNKGLTAGQLGNEMGFTKDLDPEKDKLAFKTALRKTRSIARVVVDDNNGSRSERIGKNAIYKVPAEAPAKK